MKAQLWVDVHKDGEKRVTLFRLLAEGAVPQTSVSLSRKPGGCLTPIARLWEHDGHAPVFHNESDMNAYVKRVRADVDRALKAGGTTEETTWKLLRSW
jgi:hypothetical protein